MATKVGEEDDYSDMPALCAPDSDSEPESEPKFLYHDCDTVICTKCTKPFPVWAPETPTVQECIPCRILAGNTHFGTYSISLRRPSIAGTPVTCFPQPKTTWTDKPNSFRMEFNPPIHTRVIPFEPQYPTAEQLQCPMDGLPLLYYDYYGTSYAERIDAGLKKHGHVGLTAQQRFYLAVNIHLRRSLVAPTLRHFGVSEELVAKVIIIQ
jgi:hypothetical protein